jgi:hypothetical protein
MTEKSETVALDEAKEQVRRVCARLALLHLSFARTIVGELGEEKGKELIVKAIKDYGRRIGEDARKAAALQGKDNKPENYREDLPLYGMHEGLETAEVDGEKRVRAYGCVMGKVWNELGEGKLGRYYCLVDPAKYMAYYPDCKLIHTKALPDGDPYCELVLRPTSGQEKEDFASDDRDWSYIDLK